MTAARRRKALQILAGVVVAGLLVGSYAQESLNALLDGAHYNANGVLLESSGWQNQMLTLAVLLAIAAVLVMVAALGVMVLVSWKLRFPEALLAGIGAYFPLGDAARVFAPQLLGGFGRPRDVTDTVIPLLIWVGIAGFVVAAIILVGGIVGAVRATSPKPAAVPVPPPA